MPSDSPLPYTALTRRYVELTKQSSQERLRQAQEVGAGELAAEFLQSVEAFRSFSTDQDFFDDPSGTRDGPKSAAADARTFGWAMAIKQQVRVSVAGDETLGFTYVGREIVPTRTRPRTEFDDASGHQVSIDLVLANAETGRPIFAELKIGPDKDPFSALVQALAGAAQLISPQQRARISALGQPVASPESEPLVDICVLLADFRKTGRHRFDQLRAAVSLAKSLEASGDLRGSVGRIRILAISRDSQDRVSASIELPTN